MSPLGSKPDKADKKAAKAAAKEAAKQAKAAAKGAAKAAKAAKPAAAARSVAIEKPKANIYTVMLALSLVAVMLGCVFLLVEMSMYDFQVGGR